MRVHIENNKFVITTEPKIIHFDLAKDFDTNFKHEIDSTIKHNEFLTEDTKRRD